MSVPIVCLKKKRKGELNMSMIEEKQNTIERSLYYYDLSIYTKGEDDKYKLNCAGYLRKALKYIKRKNEEIEKCCNAEEQKAKIRELMIPVSGGDRIYVIVDKIEENAPVNCRIVLSRSDAFPFIEKNGTLSNMTSEVEGEFTVAEVTHCVIYPEEFVMGAEFNFNGARPSAIAKYIPGVYNEIKSMECHGRVRNDAFNKIIKDKGYSLFEIEIKNTPQMRVAIRNNMGFLGAFIGEIDDVDSYEISIKRRITKKKKGFVPPITTEDIQKFVNDNREEIKRFRICQGVYKDCVDLLSDKLVHKKSFILTKSKVIDSEEMYNSIREFYTQVFNN